MAGPSIDRVRELLDYDPATGALTWRFSRRGASAGSLAGSRNNLGYIQVMIDRKQCLGHRIAWQIHYGVYPEKNIDHTNGVRDDNRIANLRECNQSQNNANMRGGRSKSGYKGVYIRNDDKYYAQIKINGKKKCLGVFNDPEIAHDAYMREAIKLFGEFARAA